MLRFITQHRVLFLILALVLIGLHLLTSGLKHKTDVGLAGRIAIAVYSPVYKMISWPFRLVADGLGDYVWLVHVKRDNAALRRENNELRTQLVTAAENKAENERLHNLLAMRPLELPAVAHARVIGRSDQAGFHVLVLDVGTRDRVAKGMPVVAPEGLVGFIVTATLNASKAVLITDASARADVIVQRTRRRAVLVGGGANTCTLEFLDTETDVAEGDLVVATGADGVFPKGVVVGKVVDVKRGAYGVMQSVEVAPAAPLQTIETVSVLEKRPDALELAP